MKIVHVVEATATGTLSMIALISKVQVEQGHDVSIVYSRRPETPKDLNSIFDSSIKLYYQDMYGLVNQLKSIVGLRRLYKALSPAQVILHSSFGGFVGRIAGLFCLRSTHFYYLPHCISMMRMDVGPIKKILFTIFEAIASLKKCKYVACSNSEAKVIKQYLPWVSVDVLENAVEFKHDCSSNLPLSTLKARWTVVTVGQIRSQKSPETFAKICAAVTESNPHLDFVWVGDGDELSKRILQDAGVKVTGWVPRGSVYEYLSNSDVYLSTSRWEGMPVSVIEAQLAGLVVVVSSCAGNVDIVDDKVNGFVFKDVSEALEAFKVICKLPIMAQGMAKSNIDVARKRFGADRYRNDLSKVFNNQY